ncbi:MAG: tRNA uridine-5-carboxymethylaminomethyl(34) synthesis GTPase MnmE [Maricaulaceae bacterium]|nr:tRNA uridine-5-carboxymethylaminomethyl(34) synthesis GTPase MnmE [Maricaulaceae bacterium]
MSDTIFALATPPGRSGVAVMRVSGPEAGAVLDALAGSPRPALRRAVLRPLTYADTLIDQAIVLWFQGPDSYTGEDSAEFHIHGGPAVIAALAEALAALGARPAQAGEFTRRAFENGKLDLTGAEGIADLIAAETEGQRLQALNQMRGSLRTLYESWRQHLLEVLVSIEGEIDFPDEADVPDQLSSRAAAPLRALLAELDQHLDDGRRGEIVREGFHVAIIGAPNAGKSSLLNALARREAAIVTEIPGTTRDVVEVRLVLAGFPVILADTAGLREAADLVEAEGVRRALARAEDADLRIGVADGRAPEEIAALAPRLRDGDILALNKADLGGPDQLPPEGRFLTLAVSAKTGSGLAALEKHLESLVAERLSARETPALSRARHRLAVQEARAALERALGALSRAPELAGEDARLAVRALETLTGRVDVEDILDRVFAQFCIGK